MLSKFPRHCCIALLVGALPSLSHAALSVRSGDWSDPGTWGGSVPASTEDVRIRNGHTVTVTTEPPRAGVQVDSGGSLVIADTGRLEMCVGCVFENNGTVQVAGTLVFGNDTSGSSYNNWSAFTVDAGGSVVVSRNVTFNNAIVTLTNNGHIINNGRFNNALNGNSTVVNNGTFDNNGVLVNDGEIRNTGTITVGLVDIDLGLFSSNYRFTSDGGFITTYAGSIWTSTELVYFTNGTVFTNHGSFRMTGGSHEIKSGAVFHNYGEVGGASLMLAVEGGTFYAYCGATQSRVLGDVVDICADTLFKEGFDPASAR